MEEYNMLKKHDYDNMTPHELENLMKRQDTDYQNEIKKHMESKKKNKALRDKGKLYRVPERWMDTTTDEEEVMTKDE